MKRIGIIGGLSYQSSLHYYAEINHNIGDRRGGLASADMILRSVNFAKYKKLMDEGSWDQIETRLLDEALKLREMGCNLIAIASNTMHRVAGPIEEYVKDGSTRFVHIADSIALDCQKAGATRVGLLGTKTMLEEGPIAKRLEEQGIEVVIPNEEHRRLVDRIIFDELCRGEINERSRSSLHSLVRDLYDAEALDGVILGCTELDLLFPDSDWLYPSYGSDLTVRLFDSTACHIDHLVSLSLGE